jgi:hypothetical protein
MRNVRVMFLLVGLFALLVVPALAQDASPTPDNGQQAQTTATPDTQQQAQTQTQRGNALVRAAHLISDAGVVDVYIDGQLAIQDVNPNDFSSWLELPAGRASVAIVPAGETFDDAIIGPFDVTLPANSQITIAATGSVASGQFDWSIIRENLTGQGQTSTGGVDVQDNARITLLNSVEDAPPVNLELFLVEPVATDSQSNQRSDSEFGAGSMFDLGSVDFADAGQTFTVPAGIYNVSVTPADSSEDSQPQFGTPQRDDLLTNWPSLANVSLDPNTSYVFAVVGTPDDPFLVIHANNFNQTMTLNNQSNSATQSNSAQSSNQDSSGHTNP